MFKFRVFRRPIQPPRPNIQVSNHFTLGILSRFHLSNSDTNTNQYSNIQASRTFPESLEGFSVIAGLGSDEDFEPNPIPRVLMNRIMEIF